MEVLLPRSRVRSEAGWVEAGGAAWADERVKRRRMRILEAMFISLPG
jgi:hypothetical protein